MSDFAVYQTKIGYFCIVYEQDTLLSLKKIQNPTNKEEKRTAFSNKVFAQLEEYLDGKRKTFDIKYKLRGTVFQKKVWAALCNIPYGKLVSYKDIAVAIGNPKASRAVGMANNKNPITIIVPCHRVIGSSGKLVGYASGLDVKRFLIELESSKS